MRVKLFWKNDRGALNELYKDGTFRNWKDCWKDWWSGKIQLVPPVGWQEELSFKKITRTGGRDQHLVIAKPKDQSC